MYTKYIVKTEIFDKINHKYFDVKFYFFIDTQYEPSHFYLRSISEEWLFYKLYTKIQSIIQNNFAACRIYGCNLHCVKEYEYFSENNAYFLEYENINEEELYNFGY